MPILVTRDFPPSRGGIQRYCEGLADALHAIGAPVCVVATGKSDASRFDRSKPYRIVRYTERGRIVTGAQSVAAIVEARRTIRDRHIVAAIWQPCGLEALVANAFAGGGRVTIVAHGSEITKQRAGIRRLLASNVLRRADVVAVSRFTAGAVAELGAVARVIPGGVEIRDFARAKAKDPTILTVGRLVRRKGFDRLIGALPTLTPRFPGVRLGIVGNGPDRAYLEDLARDAGVADAVTFYGEVDDAMLEALYASAWCFAMPNRTEAGYDAEGLGLVFLEAALHDVPSLGGRFSGAEDAIVDGVTGLLVDGRSQEEVTYALSTLLEDRDRSDRWGVAARARVESEFEWRDIARRILAT